MHVYENSEHFTAFYLTNYVTSFLPLWPVSLSSLGSFAAALSAGGRGCRCPGKVTQWPTAPAACCCSSGCFSGCGWLSWACTWAELEVLGHGGDQRLAVSGKSRHKDEERLRMRTCGSYWSSQSAPGDVGRSARSRCSCLL